MYIVFLSAQWTIIFQCQLYYNRMGYSRVYEKDERQNLIRITFTTITTLYATSDTCSIIHSYTSYEMKMSCASSNISKTIMWTGQQNDWDNGLHLLHPHPYHPLAMSMIQVNQFWSIQPFQTQSFNNAQFQSSHIHSTKCTMRSNWNASVRCVGISITKLYSIDIDTMMSFFKWPIDIV